jgi:hypothetical protein
MVFWIYITGVMAALAIFAGVIYFYEKKLTVGKLTASLVLSMLSWTVVVSALLALLMSLVDWGKEIWRKRE